MKQLVIGGARSGKSRFAERAAAAGGKEVVYVATARVLDAEFAARVAAHTERRPVEWLTVEAPHFLARALREHDGAGRCLLVDCLTLWLGQCLIPEMAPAEGVVWAEQRALLLETLPELQSEVILVGNEVGMGIVPLGEINRRFQDESGWLHQDLAAVCDQVYFIAAGLPLRLK